MSLPTQFTMEFRAATWYRILGNLQTIQQNDGENLLNTLMKIEDIAPFQKNLMSMIIQMNCSSALACFPTDDLAELGDMVLYTARHYHLHPEAASKISTMCGIHKLGSIMIGEGNTCPQLHRRSNGRIEEIASLNKNFLELSELIGDRYSDVTIKAEFCEMENTIFHPESQYLRVIVTV